MPTPATTRAAAADRIDAMRRDLYFLDLYRLLEAVLLCLLAFAPLLDLMQATRDSGLAQVVSVTYLVLAMLLLAAGRRLPIQRRVLLGLTVDIIALVLAMHAMPDWSTAIAMLLLFNVAGAAVLLPLRSALAAAIATVTAMALEYAWSALAGDSGSRPPAELLMFASSYVGGAMLANTLGRQLRRSQALAERRGSQVASLSEVNELVIRRMRTGVLLVDAGGVIRMANEAAVVLLGEAWREDANLADAVPELARRLQRWRRDGAQDPQPLQLAADMPQVQPRFVRLLAEDDQALVFLDDTSALSRHAENMTLATLGRFSASLAHEIRNPLAAISYATQLLEESPGLDDGDRRLLQIVFQQTQRMNGIVDNVLSLARRERAHPEHVELVAFARRFVEDYRASHPLETDRLDVVAGAQAVAALFDHGQLQQVLTTLVHNALLYGRQPGEPARVVVHVGHDQGAPSIDVTDRGPGIPEAAAAQLFRPFHTTSPHGTGLGLYIARELCRANQATLDYVAVPGGGACFRLRLVGARAIAIG